MFENSFPPSARSALRRTEGGLLFEEKSMLKETIIAKMIDFYRGNAEDIGHFLKVYAFAHTIGGMEGLDASERDTLEIAAIVHDIACPLCREKYGKSWKAVRENVFRTKTGIRFLEAEMGAGGENGDPLPRI